MLKVNQIQSDDKILIQIENEVPIGSEAGKIYKNIGIFLRPSTDYGSIAEERNVTASEDYLNILKDQELEVVNIENLNDQILINLVLATEESPLVFKFGSGDGYKRRLTLITKTDSEEYSILPVGGIFKVELKYKGSVNKRIGIEVVSGGVIE